MKHEILSIRPRYAGPRSLNSGNNVGVKRPLTQTQIWAIRFHLDREGRSRNKALFDLAIDSKLRGCDLVKIKIGHLVAGADVRNSAIVIQQKNKLPESCKAIRLLHCSHPNDFKNSSKKKSDPSHTGLLC